MLFPKEEEEEHNSVTSENLQGSPLNPLQIGETARQIPNPILVSMSPATAPGSSKYL